jgi:hypothetical protein
MVELKEFLKLAPALLRFLLSDSAAGLSTFWSHIAFMFSSDGVQFQGPHNLERNISQLVGRVALVWRLFMKGGGPD